MAANILLVDDDPDIRAIIRIALHSRGHVIHEADHGEIALAMVEDAKPDLIILDLMLPGRSGFEISKVLKSKPEFANIPIIVISGIDKKQRPEEFWRSGLRVEEFISKANFDTADLLGRVEVLLRRESYRKKQPASEPAPTSKDAENGLSDRTPGAIVRLFVEASNTGDFAAEYDCLSEKMTYGLTRSQYVERREGAARDSHQSPIEKKVQKIISVEQDEDSASVEIEKMENRGPLRRSVTHETYILLRTPKGWKIAGVRIKGRS